VSVRERVNVISLDLVCNNQTLGDKKMSFRPVDDIDKCKTALLWGFDVCTEEVKTALHDSAHRAAQLDTEVSQDVSCHASPLQCLRTATPRAACTGCLWTSDAMSSQVGRYCTGCSFYKHSAADLLQFTLICDKWLAAALHSKKGLWVHRKDIESHVVQDGDGWEQADIRDLLDW
jgi:hypothetical protein